MRNRLHPGPLLTGLVAITENFRFARGAVLYAGWVGLACMALLVRAVLIELADLIKTADLIRLPRR